MNRDAALAVSDQAVSPLLRGGTTMAKLRQAATGGDLQKAASGAMDAAMQEINTLAGNPAIAPTGALARGYDLSRRLSRMSLIGPVAPAGFTLEQAQAVRSYMDRRHLAFPHGQGITPAAQQSFWEK